MYTHIQHFLNNQDISKSSLFTYKTALNQFFKWQQVDGDEEITKATIIGYKNWLSGRGLKSTTKFSYVAVVCRFFRWANTEGIHANVGEGIKARDRRSDIHSKDSLTVPQIKKLLGNISTVSLEGKRNFAIVNLLVRTGCRLIEIVRADIKDIANKSSKDILWVRGKGRGSKDDYVHLAKDCLNPIKDYLQSRGPSSPGEPLFSSLSDRNYGQRLTTFTISRLIKKYMIKAGMKSERITAHSLRHTFGVLAMRSGMSLWEVQLAMRHQSSTTTQIYLNDIENEKRLLGAPESKISELLS